MYGTQAAIFLGERSEGFENDVKMYGTQASLCNNSLGRPFENDVKMYDTQALDDRFLLLDRLRMM